MRIIRCALMGLAMAVASAPAWTADYPTRPVRLVVPFEAGGTFDTLARLVASEIDKESRWGVVVVNRAGANTQIGTADVAKAAPDGYSILHTSPSFVINSIVNTNMPFDTFKDFTPVTSIAIGAGYLLAVRAGLEVNSVEELVKLAREKELTYGSPGIGNALHLAAASFAKKAGIDMLHVPFKGSAGALNALAAGQVDVMMLSPSTIFTYVESGKVRPIAFTGKERSREFPEIPTMQEAGLNDFVMMGTWGGWFVPTGTPPEIIQVLADKVATILKKPNVIEVLHKGGFDPAGHPPAEFAAFVQDEVARYREVVKDAGIEPR